MPRFTSHFASAITAATRAACRKAKRSAGSEALRADVTTANCSRNAAPRVRPHGVERTPHGASHTDRGPDRSGERRRTEGSRTGRGTRDANGENENRSAAKAANTKNAPLNRGNAKGNAKNAAPNRGQAKANAKPRQLRDGACRSAVTLGGTPGARTTLCDR